jgi:ubiquinone/menaquinone biosynthesis C-methylase UbiE
MTGLDNQDFKRATRDQWNEAAQGWNDHGPIIRDWLKDATEAMVEMAGVKPGDRVLDVAAGAGDQTLDIAARVGPDGYVLAIDLSEKIIEHAQRNARQAGHRNVEARAADGESLPAPDASFDAAVSRLGLMLFSDPLRSLHEIYRVLKAGGGVCTMVFSTPEANPCVGILMSTALKHAGLPPGDPFQPGGLFSLSQPGMIDALFKEAGLREVATTRISAPFTLPSARDYLAFIRVSASPIRQIMGNLTEAEQAAAWTEMEEKLRRFDRDGAWVGPNELLLTAARR